MNTLISLSQKLCRRLPVLIKTKTPTVVDRLEILVKMLKTEKLGDDVDLQHIAMMTDDFTGSGMLSIITTQSTLTFDFFTW